MPASQSSRSSVPLSPGTQQRLSRQRQKDTVPELALRRALHSMGYRFRVHVSPVPGLRRTADIVFPSERVAVFVDGCFWHCCPQHGTVPKNNREWWTAKLQRNVLRDRDTSVQLEQAGWQVMRVWEHEDSGEAALRVGQFVRSVRRCRT